MLAEQSLHVRAPPATHRRETGHDLAPPNDGEVLTPTLDGIEQVSEVPCGIGRADLGHEVRFSGRAFRPFRDSVPVFRALALALPYRWRAASPLVPRSAPILGQV